VELEQMKTGVERIGQRIGEGNEPEYENQCRGKRPNESLKRQRLSKSRELDGNGEGRTCPLDMRGVTINPKNGSFLCREETKRNVSNGIERSQLREGSVRELQKER
jgi:hypothetical protein